MMTDDQFRNSHGLRITVAIPAYNEERFLADVVGSVMDQSLARDRYEVLVIDNASSDETKNVLAQLSQEYDGRFRAITEPTEGLCFARNRALAEASAPIVAFIDADALADRDWLEQTLHSFESSDRVGAVGGPIQIKWDHPKPRWWDERLSEAMNQFNPGDQPTDLGYPRYPYGTNFAVRVGAVQALGGFATGLGRRGPSLAAGEEGELCVRLEQAGWKIRNAPEALVHHRTVGQRLRRRYILKRAFNHGRSQYLVESMHGFESARYLTWPKILGRLMSKTLRLRCDLPFLKFILFRIGYHCQRTQSRIRSIRRGTAMDTPATRLKRILSIEGQVALDEINQLFELARQVRAGQDIVEIGSFRGRSTCALASGSLAGHRNRVFAVDPHTEFVGPKGGQYGPQDQAAMYCNLTRLGLGEIVAVVSQPSMQVARGWSGNTIGLLWIDGDHRYESVRSDLDAWYGHVADEGLIVFHDTDLSDVRRVIDDAVKQNMIRPVGELKMMAWFVKV